MSDVTPSVVRPSSFYRLSASGSPSGTNDICSSSGILMIKFIPFFNEWHSVVIRCIEYFETQKQQAWALQNQINQTDSEIDQMVYALYGLSQE